MKKIVVIEDCFDCMYCDSSLPDEFYKCTKLDKTFRIDIIDTIPNNCPLENYKEKEDEKS